MRKSFIVTGASASGKTTLINEAKKNNYIYLPTHMTRKKRKFEQDGKDGIFISAEKFIENFNNDMYIEPSLEFALLKSIGIYYGTPYTWLEQLCKEGYCASPTSVTIANEIVNCSNVFWIHLYCDDKDRYERLLARGISEEEAYARMTSGDSLNSPKNADLIVNTSINSAEEILNKINDF